MDSLPGLLACFSVTQNRESEDGTLASPSAKVLYLSAPSFSRSPLSRFLTLLEHGPGAWVPTSMQRLPSNIDCFLNQLFCDPLCLEGVPACGKNTVYCIYLFC